MGEPIITRDKRYISEEALRKAARKLPIETSAVKYTGFHTHYRANLKSLEAYQAVDTFSQTKEQEAFDILVGKVADKLIDDLLKEVDNSD